MVLVYFMFFGGLVCFGKFCLSETVEIFRINSTVDGNIARIKKQIENYLEPEI